MTAVGCPACAGLPWLLKTPPRCPGCNGSGVVDSDRVNSSGERLTVKPPADVDTRACFFVVNPAKHLAMTECPRRGPRWRWTAPVYAFACGWPTRLDAVNVKDRVPVAEAKQWRVLTFAELEKLLETDPDPTPADYEKKA